ncbi:MAG TPA: RNA polymerase sigma factor [Flavobacteriales bacterium]|nr:RNA polymerase sigma factor [Flavobacteriales bacterium]
MEALKINESQIVSLSDLEVVERVRNGEKALCEILMRRHNQTLYRAVRSYLKDGDDVQDAMQEAYVKAFSKLDQYKGDAAFSTWLVRIGINEALQALRKQRALHVYADPEVRAERLTQLPDTGQMNPEQRTIREEHRRLLEQAVDRLPEDYRAVYMLREVEEMSVGEVSQSLDISEANVKVRLHRAKNMVKDALMGAQEPASAFGFGNAHCDALVAAVMARI